MKPDDPHIAENKSSSTLNETRLACAIEYDAKHLAVRMVELATTLIKLYLARQGCAEF
jgi:hypothetical protein